MALSSGSRLGSYEVLGPLGSGGMGEVYLARDARLDRQVALKIVAPSFANDPDRLARFVREAKTASSLNHTNIAHVYEIGEADGVQFIAMEYVRGEELRVCIGSRGMPIAEVIPYATQIADALDEAHSHGIVHRDLKPSNVIVTARGRVKILDFGLAKVVRSDDHLEDGGSTMPGLTVAGLVLGTLDYMSPEQIRGLDLDRRSDIFSFGVMLYQMITGRVPFASTSKTDLVFRITQTQPEPLSRYTYDVPADLERIVRKCLEKEPERRYQSARELLVDLSSLNRSGGTLPVASTVRVSAHGKRWSIAAALMGVSVLGASAWYYWQQPDAIESIAVLSDSTTEDGANAMALADGLAISIANSLSVMGTLRVAPPIRRSEGSDAVDRLAIARELGVHGALLVSVVLRDGTAILNLRLVDALHPKQEWGHQYKLRLSEIDLAQESIASEVAETLDLRFDSEQKQKQEVYQLYQRGRSHLLKRKESDLQRAIEFFELALDKDRSYARAWAGLAQAHNLLHIYSVVKPTIAAPAAKAAAERALALDNQLAEAHTQRALVSFRWEWDWAAAERAFDRALSLDESDAETRHWAAMFLTATGRFDDATRRVREAQAINPLDPVSASDLGWTLYMARSFDEAAAESERAARARPESFLAHWYLGLAEIQRGRFAEAVNALETAVTVSGGQSTLRAELATALAAAGRRSEALRIRDELLQAGQRKGFVSAYHMALISAGLGDLEASLEWLDKAARDREGLLVWAGVEPRLDVVRHDPRFRQLLAAMPLP